MKTLHAIGGALIGFLLGCLMALALSLLVFGILSICACLCAIEGYKLVVETQLEKNGGQYQGLTKTGWGILFATLGILGIAIAHGVGFVITTLSTPIFAPLGAVLLGYYGAQYELDSCLKFVGEKLSMVIANLPSIPDLIISIKSAVILAMTNISKKNEPSEQSESKGLPRVSQAGVDASAGRRYSDVPAQGQVRLSDNLPEGTEMKAAASHLQFLGPPRGDQAQTLSQDPSQQAQGIQHALAPPSYS